MKGFSQAIELYFVEMFIPTEVGGVAIHKMGISFIQL